MIITGIFIHWKLNGGLFLFPLDSASDDGDDADARGGGLRQPRQPLPQPHARLRRTPDRPLLHLANRALGELRTESEGDDARLRELL